MLDRRLVAVIGASGSGKSSLVRAGLVPLVRSGRLPGTAPWRTNVIVPGLDPLAALDGVDGLDEPEPQLLVVDQFEELFPPVRPKRSPGGWSTWFSMPRSTSTSWSSCAPISTGRSPRPGCSLSWSRTPKWWSDPPATTSCAGSSRCPPAAPAASSSLGWSTSSPTTWPAYDAALPFVSAALADVWEGRDEDTLTADRYLEVGGLAAAVERLGSTSRRAGRRRGGDP